MHTKTLWQSYDARGLTQTIWTMWKSGLVTDLRRGISHKGDSRLIHYFSFIKSRKSHGLYSTASLSFYAFWRDGRALKFLSSSQLAPKLWRFSNFHVLKDNSRSTTSADRRHVQKIITRMSISNKCFESFRRAVRQLKRCHICYKPSYAINLYSHRCPQRPCHSWPLN